MNQQGMMGNNRYQTIPSQNQQLYVNQQQRSMQQRPLQGNQEGMPQYTQFNSNSNNNNNQQQMLMAQKMQMMMQSSNMGMRGNNNNSNSNNLGNANMQNQMMLTQQQQQPSMQQFNTMKPQQRQMFVSQPQLNELNNRLTLQMTNDERNLFSKLFQFVDRENKGRLSAQEGANFLKKSGLPKETLKQIYIIAAQTSTQFLDRDDFYIALRLVALAQNNLPFTKNSIIINNPIPPLPVFNLQQNENDVDIEQVFKMEEMDKDKYKMLFDKNKEFHDKMSFGKSYQMWKSLNIHDTVIHKILTIIQPLQDKNFLNLKEFQVILHLIIKGANYEIPNALPQCIANYLHGSFNQQQNNMNMQMQQQPTSHMQMQQQQSQMNPQIQMQKQMQQQAPQIQIPQQQQPQIQIPQHQMNPHPQQQQTQLQPQMHQQQTQQQPVKKDIDLLLANIDCGLPQQQSQQAMNSIGPYLPQQQPNIIQNIPPSPGNQYQLQPQPQNFQQFQQQQPPQQYQPCQNKPEDDKAKSSILLEQIEKELRNYNDLTYQNDCLQTQLHNMKEKIKLCKEQLVKAALAITMQNDEISKANNELTEVKNQLQLTIIERERYEETYFREKAYITQQLQEKQELLRKAQEEEHKLKQLENEQIQQKKLLEEEEIAKLRGMESNSQQNQIKQQVDFEQMNYEDFLNFPSANDFPVAKDSDFPGVNENNNNQMNMNMNNSNNNNNIHNEIQQQQHLPPQNMQYNFGNIDNDFQIETNQQQQQHQIEEPDFGCHIDIPTTNEKIINPYEEDYDDKKQTLPSKFNANISPITSTNFNPSEMNYNQTEHEHNAGQHNAFPSFGSLMRDSKEINTVSGSNPPNFQFEYFNTGNTAFQDFQQKTSNDNFQLNINNNNNNNNFDDFDF